ncbi:MAG: RNA polymerase sigma factor [Prevotella sp.]|nr:RNA polymerase sigma factor [Candidatus Equicola faecalis]
MYLGGRTNFEQVVREHQESVRRLMLTLTLGDEALSDDLSQDTFLKAYRSWTAFRGLSSTRTWLFRIAYNTFYSYCRQQRAVMTDLQEYARTSQPSSLNMDIMQAMSVLTDAERLCVTLALIEGEATKEVAKITRLKENTVKSHIKRGREKLAQYLRNNGYEN